ncbi:MAG TPA: DUF2520 domain-containing protein [Planctomycetes bacterium]|nr:DUF2520 domain-containing protein [Planctomycetota bacterium]
MGGIPAGAHSRIRILGIAPARSGGGTNEEAMSDSNAGNGASDWNGAELVGVRVAVLGCGALGSALALELAAAGAVPILWSRTAGRAQALLTRLEGEGEVAGSAEIAIEDAELVLLAVADDALPGFAEELAAGLSAAAASERAPAGRAVLHLNGLRGPAVLEPLAKLGVPVGKAHPLLAVPPESGAPRTGRFRGASFAIAGDPEALGWARRLCGAFGARVLELQGDAEEASARLHAAASLVSGGLVALFDLALEAAGDRGAREPLLALVRSTLENLEETAPSEALTGAIARGSLRTVDRHLQVLDPPARAAYRTLGLRMLELARERGAGKGADALALARLLGA